MTTTTDLPIFITGAANGIGAATARLMAAKGHPLSLFDRDAKAMAALRRELSDRAILANVGDASNEADLDEAIGATVSKFGGISGACTAAGVVGTSAPIQDYPLATFDTVFDVNVRGSWMAIQKLAPIMAEKKSGSIVLVSSINGIKGFPDFSAYAASKQAVMGMGKTAALDLAPFGIRVNSIHPGFVETQMMRDVEQILSPDNAAAAKASFAAIPAMKRYCVPEEIAETIAFLLSDKSSYTTGAQLVVDGGFTTGLAG